MQYDMRSLPMIARYKILNSTVTPRPIAWITSRSEAGVVNAAPYSFFNVAGVEPPMVMICMLKEPRTRALKHTATNIVATGEFVVNLVREEDGAAMNLTSVDAPADVSEIDYAGLETAPSVTVAPPRIATSPVSFECRKVMACDIGTSQTIVIGEILMAHIADQFITDVEKIYLDNLAMHLIGRTHGSGWYVRNSDEFQMERPAYDPARINGTGDGSD
ncbi:MAG: flavin reductase family protein [Sphingomonadales bacterium]|nr:MAG: flavin reductase family protein [Sphingomonadales bacterium]TNF02729.1 MAG: flavin reductase family protein [Sphingomonadales bacterium]